MNRLRRNFNKISRLLRGRQTWNAYRIGILAVAAILLVSVLAYGAKPGGVPVLLPPFIPVQPPNPFLQAVSPFAVIGFIQSATVDNPSDVFSGGTVVVNGIKITVPRNTLFQMPASTMTWQEVFSNAPSAYKAINQTGLALSDTPKPLTTYEVNVQGNRVGDQYIAGLLFISNQSVNTGQGFINFIDYAKGEMWVGQTLRAQTGARVRLNTAKGRYGKTDPNADYRFTADEDNPTISARTGFPMCLPRVDPASGNDSLCPQWNRPVDPYTGAFSTNFTMAPASAGVPDSNGITHQVGYPTPPITPDPFEQVPMEIGDYITYNGTLTADPNGGTYISAHTVADDIGVFTAPGTWPVYVSLGEFRIGVGGTPNPLFPQEALEKIFGDAFTTDYTQLVDVYAVDVDPCTGARTHRYYFTSNPFGPPLGGLKGRARFRTTIGNFLPPTREMAVSSRSLTGFGTLDQAITAQGGALALTANGLAAGTFQAPQFNYLFPENLVMGSPTIPLPFQEFPFLVNGFGPYVPFNAGPTATAVGTIGQLSPWPSVTAPTATCTTGQTLLQPPVANAGPPQTVSSGAKVTLDGTGSSDPNTPPLPVIYTWIQASGPAVSLQDPSLAKPFFTAPTVPAGTTTPVVLTFQLATCNGYTCGGVSTVNITVTPATALTASLTATPGGSVQPGSTVTLNATASGGTGTLKYTFKQTAGVTQSLTFSGNTASFTVPATQAAGDLAFQVTVTDAANNTVTSAPVTVTVVAPAALSVTLSATPPTAAPGSLVTLNATPAGGTGPYTYAFTQPGGPAQVLTQNPASPSSASFTVPANQAAATLTFQVTVTDSASPTKAVNSASVNVTVSPALAVTLTAAPVIGVHQGSAVALNATATGGTGALKYTFTQTAGPTQTLNAPSTSTSATFAVNLPTPVPTAPTNLTFQVTVTDSAVPTNATKTASVTVNVAGADTITATPVTYVLSKSKLQVVANTTALPKGGAVLTVTPVGAPVFIFSASNTRPTVITSFAHGFAPGSTPTVTFSGATGKWSALNGTFIVKYIDADTFSVPIDTRSFPAFPANGTVSYVQSFGSDVVCTYDPSLDTYSVLADIVQPGPNAVKIRSSYGGSITAPVTRTR